MKWLVVGVVVYLVWKSQQPAGIPAPAASPAFSLTRGPWSAILPDASIAVPVWPGGYDQ